MGLQVLIFVSCGFWGLEVRVGVPFGSLEVKFRAWQGLWDHRPRKPKP